MLRPSTAQIDRGILNAAARTFATHGYARTSVQQLADAVGYSKTGLLHRFASKHILYSAALDAAAEAVEAILLTAGEAPAEHAATAILESVTERALDDPGLVALLVLTVRPASGEPGHERLRAAVDELLAALCVPDLRAPDLCAPDLRAPDLRAPEADDRAVRLRAVLALDLIVRAVATQDQDALRLDRSQLQPLVVTLAAGVLHATTGVSS